MTDSKTTAVKVVRWRKDSTGGGYHCDDLDDAHGMPIRLDVWQKRSTWTGRFCDRAYELADGSKKFDRVTEQDGFRTLREAKRWAESRVSA